MSLLTFKEKVAKKANGLFDSVITIRSEDLLKKYQDEITNYRHIQNKLPPNAPRHEEFKRINELANKLEEAIRQQDNLYFDFSDYISVFASQILFSKNFVSIHCEKCRQNYTAEDVLVQSWCEGSGLAAEGGRIIWCKEHHILYKMMEWNS